MLQLAFHFLGSLTKFLNEASKKSACTMCLRHATSPLSGLVSTSAVRQKQTGTRLSMRVRHCHTIIALTCLPLLPPSLSWCMLWGYSHSKILLLTCHTPHFPGMYPFCLECPSFTIPAIYPPGKAFGITPVIRVFVLVIV